MIFFSVNVTKMLDHLNMSIIEWHLYMVAVPAILLR